MLDKIKKGSNLSFYFIWSLIINFINILTIFLITIEVSYPSNGQGKFFVMYLLMEVFIFLDFLLKIGLFFIMKGKNDNGKEEDPFIDLHLIQTKKIFLINFTSSIPLLIIFKLIYKNKIFPKTFIIIHFIKFLRFVNINNFTTRMQSFIMYQNFKSLITLKFLMNIVYLLFFTHFSAVCWLFINSFNSAGYFKKNSHLSTLYSKYISSLSWGVATMTGCSFGDVSPGNFLENFITMIMMVFGASFYGKIFADFESILAFMHGDSSEKKFIS